MPEEILFPIYPITYLLPILSASALLLQIPALAWQIRHRNFAASCLIGWLQLMQMMYTINPIIWSTDDVFHWWSGYGLCDVEIRILIGAWVGIPGATMCIVRQLANILDSEPFLPTRAQRGRQKLLDAFLCLGFPVIIMTVYYIIQAVRFAVFTTTGCTPWVEKAWPSIPLLHIWPLIFAIINAYFAGELHEGAVIRCH
jgi:pheromone a factor receptor